MTCKLCMHNSQLSIKWQDEDMGATASFVLPRCEGPDSKCGFLSAVFASYATLNVRAAVPSLLLCHPASIAFACELLEELRCRPTPCGFAGGA
jgi:hypothetical protein